MAVSLGPRPAYCMLDQSFLDMIIVDGRVAWIYSAAAEQEDHIVLSPSASGRHG